MADVKDYEHPISNEEFRKLGYRMVDAIADYREKVESYPVRSEVAEGYLKSCLPSAAPDEAEPLAAILEDVQKHIIPGVTHWQHPSFFAWYPANSSAPAFLADMLSNALGVIGFSWIGSPAATELEMIMMDWLAKLLSLSELFQSSSGAGGGVIQGTASEACLCTMLAAKARFMAERPVEDELRLVAYTTDQAHSCVKKACMIAGIHHFRLVPTRSEDDWAMQPAALEDAVKRDVEAGLLPFYVCATIGTTSSAAVDPVATLASVARDRNLWLHVDAAYAGVFAALPEMAHHFEGVELADSFCTNPHKAMLVTFDCSALWVRDSYWLRLALSLEAQYQFAGLRHSAEKLDYKDWQVPLGRRFRALKLWFVLRMYGAASIRAYLRHRVEMANALAQLVRADTRFELAAPPAFGLICFRRAGDSNEASAALLEAVNASGKAFLVHTTLGGRHVLRFAIGGMQTQWRHVRDTWRLIQQTAEVGPRGDVTAGIEREDSKDDTDHM